MEIKRRKTRRISVGKVPIGGGAPIAIQSMTNTKTYDTKATIDQIKELEDACCEIVRVSVPDRRSARALPQIKEKISIPLIADIHFNWKMVELAVDGGADGIRINPGNMSAKDIYRTIELAKNNKIALRIGVNAGSLEQSILEKYKHPSPPALVESAMKSIKLCQNLSYECVKISVKASSVTDTIDAYRLLSKRTDYPLHIGISEAGLLKTGSIKSAVGIGILLYEGIGDTIRVSLTDNPVEEVLVGYEIQKSLGLRKGLELISCPTCSRCQIDLINLVKEIEHKLKPYKSLPIKVAVMGCVVNGPGEARESDIGIACGVDDGVLFKNGKVERKIAKTRFMHELMKSVEEYILEHHNKR